MKSLLHRDIWPKGVREGIELTMCEGKQVAPERAEGCLEAMRQLQTEGQVKPAAKALHFATGQGLLDWVQDVKTTLKANEVKQ